MKTLEHWNGRFLQLHSMLYKARKAGKDTARIEAEIKRIAKIFEQVEQF